MNIIHKLFGAPSVKNILVNVSLWAVMALGVLAASVNSGSRRLVAVAIVAAAFVFLTLFNTAEIKKTKQGGGERK